MGCRGCTGIRSFDFNEGQFICSGVNKRPSVHNDDVVKLCIRGTLQHRELEFTKKEACTVISALASTLAALEKGLYKKVNGKKLS